MTAQSPLPLHNHVQLPLSGSSSMLLIVPTNDMQQNFSIQLIQHANLANTLWLVACGIFSLAPFSPQLYAILPRLRALALPISQLLGTEYGIQTRRDRDGDCRIAKCNKVCRCGMSGVTGCDDWWKIVWGLQARMGLA